MTFTQDQLTQLKNSYARGVLKVREGDTWVEYQSMREMAQAIDRIEAEINKKPPQGGRKAVVVSR